MGAERSLTHILPKGVSMKFNAKFSHLHVDMNPRGSRNSSSKKQSNSGERRKSDYDSTWGYISSAGVPSRVPVDPDFIITFLNFNFDVFIDFSDAVLTSAGIDRLEESFMDSETLMNTEFVKPAEVVYTAKGNPIGVTMFATGKSGKKYRIVICPVSNQFTEEDIDSVSDYFGKRDPSLNRRNGVSPELHIILLMNHEVLCNDDRMNSSLKRLLYSNVHVYDKDIDSELFYTHILQIPLVFSPKAQNVDPDVALLLWAFAKTASPDFNGTTEDFVDPLPIMSRVYDAYKIFWSVVGNEGIR